MNTPVYPGRLRPAASGTFHKPRSSAGPSTRHDSLGGPPAGPVGRIGPPRRGPCRPSPPGRSLPPVASPPIVTAPRHIVLVGAYLSRSVPGTKRGSRKRPPGISRPHASLSFFHADVFWRQRSWSAFILASRRLPCQVYPPPQSVTWGGANPTATTGPAGSSMFQGELLTCFPPWARPAGERPARHNWCGLWQFRPREETPA